MKRKMGNRIAVGAVMLCAAAGSLSGCGPELVEYDTQGTPQEEASQITEENRKWVAEVIPSYGNGEDNSVISIDAEITPPATEELYVVEVERLEFDEDYKKQVLQAFFGSSQIYYGDNDHAHREKLEYQIREQQEFVYDLQRLLERQEASKEEEWTEGDIEANRERIKGEQEELQRLENLLAMAPEEPVPITDYSAQEYMGYLDGKLVHAAFKDSADTLGRIIQLEIEPEADVQFAVGEVREMNSASAKGQNPAVQEESEIQSEHEEGNLAELTFSGAIQMAKTFMQSIGLGDAIYVGGNNLAWYGNTGETRTSNEYGYVIEFSWGVDESDAGKVEELMAYSAENHMEVKSADWDWYSHADVSVTDEGVIKVWVDNPLRIKKRTQAVSRLPMEQVQKIMVNELAANPDCIRLKAESKCYNQMDFIYFPVSSKEEENTYSYVPAWRLSYVCEPEYPRFRNAVIVNALDGSIIDWAAEFTWEAWQ